MSWKDTKDRMTDSPIKIPVLPIEQPIGKFFIGVIDADDLVDITYVDRREMKKESGGFIGIQRELNESRRKILEKYVNTADATFPTSVVLSVSGDCATLEDGYLILKPYEDTDNPEGNIPKDQIAQVIDGQHRIEGLKNLSSDVVFQTNVTIFVDMEIADQAMVFSTVNLHQSKVNSSLVYDLYELATSRSPQKTAHDITVVLNDLEKSPFYERIKRLGKVTPGKEYETITQASMVQMLLRYISSDPMLDRSNILEEKPLKPAEGKELQRLIFRNLFIEGKDEDITKIVWSFFAAVAERWPEAWSKNESDDALEQRGYVLHRTNGFRACMRYMHDAYLKILEENSLEIGSIVSKQKFKEKLDPVPLRDADFTTENFNPGSGGEGRLYRILSGSERLN